MKNYRKKPVIIQATQYTSDNVQELIDEIGASAFYCNNLFIRTLEGDMKASVGDYIIKGISGEYYPCKPDIFESSYDLVD
jgi:hypothetical protein